MLTIKVPETYINEPDILRDAGKYITIYGRKALVISGKTAWEKVKAPLAESLGEWKCELILQIMEGYPTYAKVKEYVQRAFELQADVIVGVGGGKVCDMAKAVGNFRGLPVVEIPTIAATCACWAARSVLYAEDGNYDFRQWNQQNSKLILADTRVIMDAPKRYLASGIVDSMAKWYEFEPLIEKTPTDVVLRQDVAAARLVFDILKEYGYRAMEKNKLAIEEEKQVVDAILYLTGVTGSFARGKAFVGFAHPFYYATTRIPGARFLMHGERVAFGLLVQFILQKKEEKILNSYLDDLEHYKIMYTLDTWGFTENKKNVAEEISSILMKEWPVVVEKGFAGSEEEITGAILEADDLLNARKTGKR